ncbi:MAG: DinB family protein [Polaromonas sp.]|nr:DinB family protein [Gemmatimonadaceae bacterium]
MTPTSAAPEAFITLDATLAHWQAHRRLTRRTIDAFPEDQLFTFSLGGMRSFGDLALEILGMAVPTARGILTDDWSAFTMPTSGAKGDLLRAWDESTPELATIWTQIPAARFHETMTAFGQYTMAGHDLVLYVIDNEIHHRGQGYVYLRALGIEPPPFYDRS